ncbi:acyl-CoA N-acyltransferase [Gyrodon lividus]|nr:acyl-CoA N-acyltransferase [Gyrodon lividus]
MFTTDRLLLCPYTEADLDDLLMLWNDPLVQRLATTGELAPRGPQFKKYLRTQMECATFGAIIRLKETGEFIGQIVVHVLERMNRDGTYGICLLPKFWNHGYGTEATMFMVEHSFRWIGLQRLSLSVFASNGRAIAAYEKAGFMMEGRKRASAWTNNRWEDVLFMGILRDEWIEKLSILYQ